MDWGGCCDHDNGGGREYSWWIVQKLTDAYHLGTNYVPMFAYERSVRYPEGHRNVVFPRRGIRPLPRLPKMDDGLGPNARAGHPDALPLPASSSTASWPRTPPAPTWAPTGATTIRILEPVVEIYQGDRQNYEMPGAPRSNSADDSIGGWRPLGFVSLALKKGYRLGFQASSDHISTHMSYCNLWVTAPTREAIMEAFHKRRVYGATDNILADVRCGGHFMGEEFTTSEPPAISVKLWGAGEFRQGPRHQGRRVRLLDRSRTPRTWISSGRTRPPKKGKTSYYYVRGEQADGELVWVSPMWITYRR